MTPTLGPNRQVKPFNTISFGSDDMNTDIASHTLDEIRRASSVPIDVVADKDALATAFALDVLHHVTAKNRQGERAVVILPVGPTGQWAKIAEFAERDGIDLAGLRIVTMDEYLLPDASAVVPETHPLSFAAFIRRNFLEKAEACGFRQEQWVAPDPADTKNVARMIADWGGVDIAYAGIGLNGHLAFNEPPAPDEDWTEETFANSQTRVQRIAETTKTTNSIFGTGGDLTKVPDYAVTIGMRQVLGAKQVHVFLDWPWQCNVLRRALLGPATMRFPASLLQNHPDVRFSVTADVAAVHEMVPE